MRFLGEAVCAVPGVLFSLTEISGLCHFFELDIFEKVVVFRQPNVGPVKSFLDPWTRDPTLQLQTHIRKVGGWNEIWVPESGIDQKGRQQPSQYPRVLHDLATDLEAGRSEVGSTQRHQSRSDIQYSLHADINTTNDFAGSEYPYSTTKPVQMVADE